MYGRSVHSIFKISCFNASWCSVQKPDFQSLTGCSLYMLKSIAVRLSVNVFITAASEVLCNAASKYSSRLNFPMYRHAWCVWDRWVVTNPSQFSQTRQNICHAISFAETFKSFLLMRFRRNRTIISFSSISIFAVRTVNVKWKGSYEHFPFKPRSPRLLNCSR